MTRGECLANEKIRKIILFPSIPREKNNSVRLNNFYVIKDAKSLE